MASEKEGAGISHRDFMKWLHSIAVVVQEILTKRELLLKVCKSGLGEESAGRESTSSQFGTPSRGANDASYFKPDPRKALVSLMCSIAGQKGWRDNIINSESNAVTHGSPLYEAGLCEFGGTEVFKGSKSCINANSGGGGRAPDVGSGLGWVSLTFQVPAEAKTGSTVFVAKTANDLEEKFKLLIAMLAKL